MNQNAELDIFLNKIKNNKSLNTKEHTEFNNQLREEIEKKNISVTKSDDGNFLILQSVTLIKKSDDGYGFSKRYEQHMDEEVKQILAKEFNDKELIEKTFSYDRQKEMESIVEYYNNNIKKCISISKKKNKGGEIRGKKGDFTEVIAEMICNLSVKELNCIHNQTKTFVTKKEDLVISHKFDPKIQYNMICDRVLTLDKKKALHIESKSYADLSMYKRVIFDANLIQSHDPKIPCLLFELEKGIKDESESLKVLNSHYPDVKIHI